MQNVILFLGTGLVPLIIGFLYYNNTFGLGKIWMKENGFTQDYLEKNFSPLKVFGSAYLFGILIATALMPMTVHQMGLTSMVADNPALQDPNSELSRTVNGLLTTYGTNFRSFGHGAIHGLIYSLFLVFPLIGINSLFEHRSWKYIFLHTGYWVITLMIMGGLVCQFLQL
jgi:Protein of unknown function (DUF1761)